MNARIKAVILGPMGKTGGIQLETARKSEDDTEGSYDEHGSHMGEDKVQVTGFSVVRILMVVDYQEKRGEGHHFPSHKERDHIVGRSRPAPWKRPGD